MSYTIVGVIGHIDHGKTSIVAALTGVDTDTHPEEKRRGITIDLGFASYNDGEHTFALIDAPGHQKYIGNLLAGVSALDIGLLVVACDQGIQAQTLEHASILQSLGVSRLIVVISRIDLSDEATRSELSEELDLFLADYGFHDIPKVPVSTVTGIGLSELRTLLVRMARSTQRPADGAFRMPVDRVFNIEGRGCVVAGTPWSGTVNVGDHLQLMPIGKRVRVRELEVHDQSVSQSCPGQRTAMNLTGVSLHDVARGDELVAEDTHPPTRRIVVQMNLFRDANEIRCPATVQLHTATRSCEARILGAGRIGAGESAIVVVDTDQPIVATYLQQCLFRLPYPVGSFAGGRILASIERAARQTTRALAFGAQLVDAGSAETLAAWVDFLGELDLTSPRSALQLGLDPAAIDSAVEAGTQRGWFDRPQQHLLVSRHNVARIRSQTEKLLASQAETTENAWLAEESVVTRSRNAGSPAVVRWVIDNLVREKSLVRVNKMVAVASSATVLSKKQRSQMERLLELYAESRMPPTLKEVAAELGATADAATSLIRFATGQQILIDLGNGFFVSSDTFHVLCEELRALFDTSQQQSVAAIRDHWQVTRKHAIPLLEYCDQAAITIRSGDARTAGPGLERLLSDP